MLEQTGLAERAGDELGTLSGGNRQRVNIAVGLLAEPPVLLLDEPSSSLDPRQRARLWEFVGEQAARGTAVIFSTHDVQEAERYADRVLVLADGELLFAGTPARAARRRRRRRRGRRRDFEARVRRVPARAGALTLMRWLLLKDLRSCGARRCWSRCSIYPIAIALLIGFALSGGPGKPTIALVNEIPTRSAASTSPAPELNRERVPARPAHAVTRSSTHRRERAGLVRDGKVLGP